MASMNAGIILAGQPLNTLAALNAGTTAARNTNQVRQENALTNLYQTQGPGLMAGDPAALNALSRLNPEAAFGLRADQERLQLAQAAGARAAASAAASQSAAERAAQEEQIRRGLDAARTAQTAEEWDALAVQFGAEDLVGQFGQRDAVIAFYEGYSAPQAPSYREFDGNLYAETPQGLEVAIEGTPEATSEPAAIAALRIRAQEAGLREGTPEYMEFMLTGGARQEPLVTVTNGTPPANADYLEARQGQFADRMQSIEEAEVSARSALQSLQVMENAMNDPDFYSGAGGDTAILLRRAAVALGLSDPESVADMETFNARAQAAALEAMGGSLGAGFSNADRDFVVNQVPNMNNTPAGNRRLIQIQQAIQTRNLEIARMAREYETANGQLDTQFLVQLDQWSEENPLFTPADRPTEPASDQRTAENPPPQGTATDSRMSEDGTIPFSELSEDEIRGLRDAVASGSVSLAQAQRSFPGFQP